MKGKKLISFCLGTLVAVSSMVTVFAQDTLTTGNNISIETEGNIQPRSFSRKWGGNMRVTGKRWTKIAWDINAYNETHYTITLTDDCGFPLKFRLVISPDKEDGEDAEDEEYEFTLEEGETITYTSTNRGGFALYTTYVNENDYGLPSGHINLGPA